ncbi:hypothetical protein A2899_05240 [Candidatus Amesbacteria bacterium RIFCSPLOWO2_01_FULL_49_25]|uniref:SpoVT-AbrB domain-containing protein n=1 Tax=Candidatus Amesbacteria bacterium RIFCSPHIGHO2_01_FULL_48_32b TaxID=1797253 RepID=A0A1F4YCL1_9BACT|nr:MAG: hypothetical protein A2876_03540 [Candidatus Amesbacteria bacterium RIFCSPHIGHO2_01_FULL_48_32b]OGD06759.1 MAG: hypothetical protein A2899_05240 [Candidatus Amesbacteria bacterium RIFCSPLOWO2_01_FULL_49_25]
MTHLVTVTSQGQISIPAPLRRQFQLDKIRKAFVHAENGKIIITPSADIPSLRGIFASTKRLPYKTTRAAFETAMSKGLA